MPSSTILLPGHCILNRSLPANALVALTVEHIAATAAAADVNRS